MVKKSDSGLNLIRHGRVDEPVIHVLLDFWWYLLAAEMHKLSWLRGGLFLTYTSQMHLWFSYLIDCVLQNIAVSYQVVLHQI